MNTTPAPAAADTPEPEQFPARATPAGLLEPLRITRRGLWHLGDIRSVAHLYGIREAYTADYSALCRGLRIACVAIEHERPEWVAWMLEQRRAQDAAEKARSTPPAPAQPCTVTPNPATGPGVV